MAHFAPSLFLVWAIALGHVNSGYLITTPRRWTINAESQVCVSLTQGGFASPGDALSYNLTEVTKKGTLQKGELALPAGGNNHCVNVSVPYTDERHATLTLGGSLAGDVVEQSVNLTFVPEARRTFVQTDKYLYKPGHNVQMRILSVNGPDLNVVTDPYEEVYIRDPERTLIAQWHNVSNDQGLVHLEYELHNEVDEGRYTVGVKFPDQRADERVFRVEDYVLPRYEVTVEAPKDILGSDTTVTLKLCARYTFGEPVRGNVTLHLATGSWKVYANLTQTKNISGCQNFTYSTSDLLFDNNNCHIRINTLKARAIVEEAGTGVTLYGSDDNIRVNRRAINFKDESATWIKKQYLPSLVKIATTFPGGQPATNETMEVCTFYNDEDVCTNFTTSSRGYLTFVMPSQINSRVSINAVRFPRLERNWNDVMEASRHYKYSYSNEEYVDTSNSSLTIFVAESLQCTTGDSINVTLPVIYIAGGRQEAADVHVQVMSRGQVVALKKVTVALTGTDLPFKPEEQIIPLEPVPEGVVRGVVEVNLELPASVSPKIDVVVWYSTIDGNIVADSREIQITDCLPHKVDFAFSTQKAGPGDQANLVLTGANDALCSIGVVDKSVELLSSQNSQLDVQSILQVAYNSEPSEWDEDQLDLEFCLKKYNESGAGSSTPNDPSAPPSLDIGASDFSFNPYRMLEAIHMFNSAGYYVISNLVLEKLFCEDLIIKDLKKKAAALSVTVPEDSFLDSDRQPGIASFGGGIAHDLQPVHAVSAHRPPAPQSISVPQDKEGVPAADETQERNYLPETWLWMLKPLSATGELSEPVTLPHTITEWVGRAVCVHPTKGVGISPTSSVVTFTPFFVELTLPSTVKRGEVLPLTISVFNYLDNDLSVKVAAEKSPDFTFVDGETGVRDLCVPAKQKVVMTAKVILNTIGEVNVTVDAGTDGAISCGSGTNEAHKSDRLVRSLRVEPEGYPREKVQVKYVCAEDSGVPAAPFKIEAPADIVEGSARAWIEAMGDLMGPTVENIEHLVGLPSGCGEQNMVRFAPNIYILQYLEASNQITPFLRTRLTKTLRHGYNRQLHFRHSNGSFSAFGTRDKQGSTWLTAFVVKSLSGAKPYTHVDDKLLTESADWLKSLQNEKGCFESRGRLINKMMQGGLKGSDGSEALLTAYVLASLLEGGSLPSNETSSALACISTDTSLHPYSLALKAYTLALAKAPEAKALVDQLLAVAVTNSSDMRWNLPDRKGQNTALHVETAAYALLALVTHDYETYSESAKKIVRWISGLRNGQGGFVSTQDTVVALQALAAFEQAQPQGALDMTVSLASTNLSHAFQINNNNKFLQQLVDVPVLPATLDLTSTGQGCALVQGVLRYNVHADTQSEAFILHVNTSLDTTKSETDCRTQRITACASYTLPDGASNMAILEVKLISGYVPLKQDLKDVVKGGTGGVFKRYEVDGPKVFFYLEEINAEGVCASFRAYREVAVEKAKPGSVSVYDYYQPELETTQKFTFNTDNCTAAA